VDEAEAIVRRYPEFEFVGLRLENAFDPVWAEKHALNTKQSYQVDLSDPCQYTLSMECDLFAYTLQSSLFLSQQSRTHLPGPCDATFNLFQQ
jgi:hypothetical protein